QASARRGRRRGRRRLVEYGARLHAASPFNCPGLSGFKRTHHSWGTLKRRKRRAPRRLRRAYFGWEPSRSYMLLVGPEVGSGLFVGGNEVGGNGTLGLPFADAFAAPASAAAAGLTVRAS